MKPTTRSQTSKSSSSLSAEPKSGDKRKQDNDDEQKVVNPSKKAKIGNVLAKSTEVFADPTYDVAFKMLFGSDKHKNLLISLINNLLNFVGTEQEITDVELISQEIPLEYSGHIKTIIDVRCTTSNLKEEIIVEIQRQYKDYFLPRTQHYMARTIAYQMKKGGAQTYHTDLTKVYMLIISRENIFIGNYDLKLGKKDVSFEKEILPIIKQTGTEVPANLMHWIFYEIKRFVEVFKGKEIDASSPLKHQWLNFLDKCGSQKAIPDNINELIKEAYMIMEVSEWTPKQLEAYENAKQRELDEQWEMEKEKSKAEGIEEGKLKVIKESLKGLVIAIKQKLEHNLIKSIFSLFEEEQITTIEKHISKGHVLDNGQYQDCDCNADGLAKLIGLEPSLQLDVHSSNLE